ncbi:Tn3 family transposase [Streptomyces sp. NPDC018056]|uniref:Tn3 family transposase n=1 Tax=Streptomyces sp. NPDC018056 TaxID=3365039 RepID=UPI0037A6247A
MRLFIADLEMCQGIHERLQVVGELEQRERALFPHSKEGDLAGPDKEPQEVSMLALHLLQSSLVNVSTLLLMQEVLADPKWADKLTDADRQALSPLFWIHVTPYGRFEPGMNSYLDPDRPPGLRRPAHPAVGGSLSSGVAPGLRAWPDAWWRTTLPGTSQRPGQRG